jgi:hypothetical protein
MWSTVMARRVRLLLAVSVQLVGAAVPAYAGRIGGLLGGGYGVPTKWHATGELIYGWDRGAAFGGFIAGAQIGGGAFAGSLGYYRSVGNSTNTVGLQVLGGRTFSDPRALARNRGFVGVEALYSPIMPFVFVHAGVLHHPGRTVFGWRVGVRIPIPLFPDGFGPYHSGCRRTKKLRRTRDGNAAASPLNSVFYGRQSE